MIGCDCAVCNSNDVHDKRLRSSLFIVVDGLNYCIDAGPDFREQMLRYRINKLDALLLTHGHRDHIAGFDELRSFNYLQNWEPIDVYASKITQKDLKQQYDYIFSPNPYPGIPKVTLHTIEKDGFQIGDTQVIPIPVMHHKLQVTGFRIKDFTYITDANFISKESMKKIAGTKVLVLNALRIEKHLSHFNLAEALDIIEEIRPEQAYLTHISHQLGAHEIINNQLPPNVNLAYDGLELII